METKQQEKSLRFFIDYYNTEKELLSGNGNSASYETADINYSEIIKTKALNKTLALIEEEFDVHNPIIEGSTISSICVGTLAGGITAGATNGILSDSASFTATAIATAGTIILSEYVWLKKSKAIKNHEKNIKTAEKMSQAVRNYRINDKSDLLENFTKNPETKEASFTK